jgi:hypothetical protein
MLSFLVKLAEPIVDNRYVSFNSDDNSVHIGKVCGPDDDEEENGDIFKNRLKLGTKDLPYYYLKYLSLQRIGQSHSSV